MIFFKQCCKNKVEIISNILVNCYLYFWQVAVNMSSIPQSSTGNLTEKSFIDVGMLDVTNFYNTSLLYFARELSWFCYWGIKHDFCGFFKTSFVRKIKQKCLLLESLIKTVFTWKYIRIYILIYKSVFDTEETQESTEHSSF